MNFLAPFRRVGMGDDHLTRRSCLGLVGAALTVGAAGCSNEAPSAAQSDESGTERQAETPDGGGQDGGLGENAFTKLYDRTVGSVVLIRTPGGSLGSGWVYGESHVVTNYHVVQGAGTVDVTFARGESVTAQVIGRDAYSDLAVVRLPRKPDYAEPLPLAKSEPEIGTRVAAIGSPYGLEGSMTAGIVSAVNRLVPSPNAKEFQIPNAIQTDAAVNPGNSGGPLVDLDGIVLGVINSGGGENIAFAISAALVRRVVPALIKHGTYRHPYLGVGVVDVTDLVARANGLRRPRGVLVTNVDPTSPAAGKLRGASGTKRVNGFAVPTGGDVILAIDGTTISTPQAFASYLALQTHPGERVTLTILRNGERRQVQVTVGARPPPSSGAGG
jgi:S1-C subfamily serine protease